MSAQEQTKLGVMLESLQDLFKLVPTNNPLDGGMMAMMAPVLEQGLVLIARRVNKSQPAQLEEAQRLFGLALQALSNGLADDSVTVDDYADRLREQLHGLAKQVKASQKAAAASV